MGGHGGAAEAKARRPMLSRSFLASAMKLSQPLRHRAIRAAYKFAEAPSRTGENLKKLRGNLWSIRVNQDVRVILYRDGQKDVFLYVDHHDQAYDWADRHVFDQHPVTGAMQLVEREEVLQARLAEALGAQPAPAQRPTPPFAHIDRDTLLRLGVPAPLVDLVRSVDLPEQVEHLLRALPAEAAEALRAVDDGTPVEQLLPRETPEQPVEERTFDPRDFAELPSEAEVLEQALQGAFEHWMLFLHPSQARLVEHRGRGPLKITGPAGTGKTVVALHRAHRLACDGQDVLLTTFSSSLAEQLAHKLDRLCGMVARSKIRVATVATVAKEILEEALGRPIEVFEPADEARRRRFEETMRERAAALDVDEPVAFLLDEWRQVFEPEALRSVDEYLGARREGRPRRLRAPRRRAIGTLFLDVRERLAPGPHQFAGWSWAARRAAELVAERRVDPDYQAVVVDELQDLGTPEVALVRSIAAATDPDLGNLTLAGDPRQRIYPRRARLKDVGIETRGRGSRRLDLNYRTTHCIRWAADTVLAGAYESFEPGDETEDRELRTKDGRSLRQGEPVLLRAYPGETAELEGIAAMLEEWLREGFEPSTVGVFARRGSTLTALRDALQARNLPVHRLERGERPDGRSVTLATMHRAKGLEFRAVLLAGCSQANLPPTSRREQVGPDGLEELFEAERRLLYVAMTRARDRLALCWHGAPSELLAPLWDLDGRFVRIEEARAN